MPTEVLDSAAYFIRHVASGPQTARPKSISDIAIFATPSKLFQTLYVGDQRLQIIRRKIDGRHAASLHFRGEVFEKLG
jgi:hypothetical protein